MLFKVTNYFETTSINDDTYYDQILDELGENITKRSKFEMFWEWWQIQTTAYQKNN